MTTTPEDVDGAAWRAELERWHAELANTIYQASLWAREFHVRTGDSRWGDASAPPSHPLLGYAERLETIGATLKMVCANASLNPPIPRWDRTTLKAPPRIQIPGHDPDWRDADYTEGGRYLLSIRPSAPNSDSVTSQQHWCAALALSAPSVLESHLGIPQPPCTRSRPRDCSTSPTTRFVRLSGTAWPPPSAGYGRRGLLQKTARGL